MKIKSLPQYERPMEKCLSLGVESLTNGELIAILINSGTKERSAVDLAEEVLAKDQAGIGYLRESSLEELMTVKGIGSSKAARIVAAVELGKRIALKPVQKGMKIQDDEDVAELFMEEMRRLKKEMFKAVLTVSIGELNSTIVHPREVFSQAVRKSAAAIVFVHNHPSGDPMPSGEDVATTARLRECGKLLGIRVVDHLIIGDGRYMSLRAMGKI